MKQKLYALINQRAGLLQKAEEALTANNQADYQSLMEQITNLNAEIQQVQDLVAEQERQMLSAPGPTGSELARSADGRVAVYTTLQSNPVAEDDPLYDFFQTLPNELATVTESFAFLDAEENA